MLYLGHKRDYVKYIVPLLQQIIYKHNIKIFIDGCCGGCNIIKDIKCERRIGIDHDEYLIAFYQYIQNTKNPQLFKITKEQWDLCRKYYELFPKWFVGYVSIFASYLYGGFKKGYVGDKIDCDYIGNRIAILKEEIPSLKNIEFICQDINDIVAKDCLIYIDPPHYNLKRYNFDLFFNYTIFWDTVRQLSVDNIVIVSEYQAPSDFFCIWEEDTYRQIIKKKNTEKLFIWKESKGEINGSI